MRFAWFTLAASIRVNGMVNSLPFRFMTTASPSRPMYSPWMLLPSLLFHTSGPVGAAVEELAGAGFVAAPPGEGVGPETDDAVGAGFSDESSMGRMVTSHSLTT